ncbi:MAG: hypothetical protein WD040_07020 [Anaerolineales bacterium]
MPGTPRKTLIDGFADSLTCAICGQATLMLVHHAQLPDHVTCSNCGSAFVVEDGGDRVMYGKIPESYPVVRRFALRQWAWPEAIARKAAPERTSHQAVENSSGPLAPPAPLASSEAGPGRLMGGFADSDLMPEPASPSPEAGIEEEAAIRARLLSVQEDDDYISPVPYMPGSRPAPSVPKPVEPPAALRPNEEPVVIPQVADEPPRGVRYRVVLSGDELEVPRQVCAHDLRTPVRGSITVFGQLASSTPTSRRRSIRLEVPLCVDCRRRASARSPEETTSRLQAHLISAVVALGAVVSGLALRLVDLQTEPAIGLFFLLTLAVLGYGLTAVLLLGRTSRMPLPEDAVYVRTTLIVPPEVEGLATAFEWRNPGFARLFQEANPGNTVGKVVEVRRPE